MPMARGMSQMLSSRIVGQSASLDKAEEDLDMSLDNLNQMILELDPTFEPLPVRSHTTNKSLNKDDSPEEKTVTGCILLSRGCSSGEKQVESTPFCNVASLTLHSVPRRRGSYSPQGSVVFSSSPSSSRPVPCDSFRRQQRLPSHQSEVAGSPVTLPMLCGTHHGSATSLLSTSPVSDTSYIMGSCQSLLSDDNDSCLDSNLFSPHDPLTDDSHTNRTFTPMQNQGVSLLHPNTCPPLMGVSLTDIPVVLVNGTPVPSLSPVVNVNQNFHTRSGSRSPSPQDKTFCLNSRQFLGSKSNMKFVMDTSQYWFRPQITREEADALLRDQEPGSFVVRDSTSYKGSFDLAMKVPTNPTSLCKAENSSEHIKHFLIESSVKGVRVKGSSQEQYFGSLSALIYQHTISAYALPSKLVICSQDLKKGEQGGQDTDKEVAKAASNFLFLSAVPVEMLTGSCAVQRAVSIIFKSQADQITPTIVNLMVSPKGMTLTDIQRKLFFRRHYPIHLLSYGGEDPEDRRWQKDCKSARLFGIITKGTEPGAENVCHVFAEYNPSQLCSSILHLIQRITAKSQI
ncbi:tensin-4-like [Denticeps clupeoides]|uniref:SH2 domain-containing protein n=1 Tax=Denticeps clupeoides TaxID=299321 RepID=A0AAY4DEB1_9TELE|nr:tensin-4 [Denticeps clupeoides]